MDIIKRFIGLAGVAPDETDAAKRVGRYFGILLMGAVLWLMVQWHLELNHALDPFHAWLANLLIWAFFVVETGLLTILVRDKARYLKHNWLNVLIIIH